MDRKDFLKKIGAACAASLVDFSGLKSVLAKGETSVVKGGVDLVAVMGGEPEAMLERMLAEYGGISKFVKEGQTVVLKPNIGWDKTPEMAANTNPQLVKAMVKQCLDAGAKEVLVFDHTCDNWQKCYERSGISEAVKAAGGKMIPGNDKSYYIDIDLPQAVVLKKTKVHKVLHECDVWFNMPVLKNHGGAKITIAMKNYMGIVWDRSYFHQNDLQQCIADLVTYPKRPALHIVDAYRIMKENGPQGKSEADTAVLKTLLASADPVAVDTAALKFFNQVSKMTLEEASHIGKAEALNLGTTKIDTINVSRIRMNK